jgi:hypothetical protein
MARDPDEGGAFVFDLVDDELAGGGAPSASGRDGLADGGPDGGDPDGVVPEAGGAPPLDALGRRLRTLAPVAAMLAIALGTGFAVDGMRDAARIERIREMPGGVVDVSAPLEEVWAWEGQVGAEDSMEGFATADLQGVLAFRSEGALVGLDPASGERAWSVPLGEDPECGPLAYPGMERLATSSIVCLQGAGAAREAIAVGPGGVVSEPRALDAADDRRYGTPRPGPDGTVLRAKRIGPESAMDVGDARCAVLTGECSGTVEAGRDLLLRAEDAATGELRWSVTVPFRATAAGNCTSWGGFPWGGWEELSADGALAPDVFGAQIGAGIVDLWGCGIWAAVTADGVPLRTDAVPGSATVFAVGNGGYATTTFDRAESEGGERTTLFDSDGDVVGEIPGYATGPQATDGADAATLLGYGESGYRMLSYEADGTERWDVAVQEGSPEFLAQVAGTMVTASWTGSVHGFDLATGEERWTWEPGEIPEAASFGNGYASKAFTDGRFVLLLLHSEAGSTELASLDVTSGESAWDWTTADVVSLEQDASLISVDGHLLAITPQSIRGLG